MSAELASVLLFAIFIAGIIALEIINKCSSPQTPKETHKKKKNVNEEDEDNFTSTI